MNVITAAFPWLSVLVALPLLGAFALAFIPPLRAQARNFGLLISGAEAAVLIAATATLDFTQLGNFQLAETYAWITPLGVHWALGVNGLSLAMLLLSVVLVPLVLAANADRHSSGYVAWTLALEAFIILIFAARDVFLFYLAFEAMLVPVYFLIGRYGRPGREKAAMKFLLYSLAGGLIMLVGVITLYVLTLGAGKPTYLVEELAGALPPQLQTLIFVTFFIAFAIKAPMVPVHTWLADSTEHADSGTSTLLVGILDKIGTYGMIMFCLTITPNAAAYFRVPILVLAVVSVLYGALAALAQKDLMRLISFTSVSHFGFIVMGIFIGSKLALVGAMIYMVAHGLSIAGMFLIGGFLTERGGTQEIRAYGGLQRVTPVLAGTFLVVGLAAIALPGLSGFPAEYMVLLGSFQVNPWYAGVAVFGAILAALYLLWPYQIIFTGRVKQQHAQLADLNGREKAVVAPLIAAMLVIGFWPAPVIDTVEPVATQITAGYSSTVVGQQAEGK